MAAHGFHRPMKASRARRGPTHARAGGPRSIRGLMRSHHGVRVSVFGPQVGGAFFVAGLSPRRGLSWGRPTMTQTAEVRPHPAPEVFEMYRRLTRERPAFELKARGRAQACDDVVHGSHGANGLCADGRPTSARRVDESSCVCIAERVSGPEPPHALSCARKNHMLSPEHKRKRAAGSEIPTARHGGGSRRRQSVFKNATRSALSCSLNSEPRPMRSVTTSVSTRSSKVAAEPSCR